MTRVTPPRALRGTPASAGIAVGPWIVIRPQPLPVGGRIDPAAPGVAAAEIDRLTAATAASARDLEAIARDVAAAGHPDEGEIFDAQAAMALDPALASLAAERIHAGDDVIGAVLAAAQALADQLASLGDELLAARSADVVDVGSRIARRLAGAIEAGPTLGRPSVVAAHDLAPSTTAALPRDRLLGLALEGGSPTAHAAILARAYGIPAVVGAAGLLDALAEAGTHGVEGDSIALDGRTGEIIVAPDAATLEAFERRRSVADAESRAAFEESVLDAVTREGTAVELLANIGTPAESSRAVALGARGVGLFRTEFLFMERRAEPSEEEQLAAYREVLVAFAPHPVTIRLLDAGGDKPIPYLPIASEANPFLGVRALRLAADRPALFVRQLRAILRAAATPGIGPVKVMAPMVADAGDADLLLDLLGTARDELVEAGIDQGAISVGAMLEIPSSILVADTYLERLGFASLGTNDLLQYTVAIDRGNPALARYQDPLHPALLRLVRSAVASAERAGVELSVCGEMAGDPVAAVGLVGLGIRRLSMASSSLAPVRRAIRSVDLGDARASAEAALDDPSAQAARSRFEALLEG